MLAGKISCDEACDLIKRYPGQYQIFEYNDCYEGLGDIKVECSEWMKTCDEEIEEVRFLRGIEKFGTEDCMATRYSRMGVCLVKTEFKPWMSVHEHDGLHTPYSDRREYESEAIAKHFEKNDMLKKEDLETIRSPASLRDVFTRIHFGPEVKLPPREGKNLQLL